MKISFNTSDSLYHIFKTIKKIPSWRKVTIFIDAEHDFFENKWWGKQLKEILEQYNIQATCIVTNEKTAKYFKKLNIPIHYKYKNIWQKGLQSLKVLLQKGKYIHSNLIIENTYISYFVIISEIIVIFSLLYFFRGLISPNANIAIQPAYHIENIVYNYMYYPENKPFTGNSEVLRIPYHQGSIPFEHQMTLNVQNINYDIKNAGGKIKIINSLAEPFSLLDKTKFVTDEGIIFTANTPINVPSGTENNPGIAFVDVTALPYTEQGAIIGDLGNIKSDKKLWIKNLSESMIQKKIYAITVKDFDKGATNATGTVIAEDISKIESKIIEYMKDKTKEKLRESFQDEDKEILFFDDLISFNIDEFITTSHIGDATSFIEGKVKAHIDFIYIEKVDLIHAVDMYLQQRPSENLILLDYDEHSLTFYKIEKKDKNGILFIPTKLNIVQGYNFNKDNNELIQEIKSKIIGIRKDEAKDILLNYEEIQDVEISISPPRYDTLPQVKSRIKIKIQEK